MITKEKLIEWIDNNSSAADLLSKQEEILFYLRGGKEKSAKEAKK